MNLLLAFLILIGIALQVGGAIGKLSSKEKAGAIIAGFFLEAIGGAFLYFG